MTRQNKIGLTIIIGILAFLGIMLVLTFDRPSGPTRGFDDNVLIQQRMDNLDKSR